jgi:hypothetical protein
MKIKKTQKINIELNNQEIASLETILEFAHDGMEKSNPTTEPAIKKIQDLNDFLTELKATLK